MYPEHRSSSAGFRRRLGSLYITTVLSIFALGGCSSEEVPEGATSAAAGTESGSRALNESVAISGNRAATSLTAAAQATVEPQGDRIVVHATGEDPQLTFGVTGANARPTAVYVDIESPAATGVELFYQVQNGPFSADHVISTAAKSGRNQILFEVNHPAFSGWFRLDPGQTGGQYTIHSLVVFSDQPMRLIAPERPQEELAAAFEGSKQAVFRATGEQLSQMKPLNDLEVAPAPDGLLLKATGVDPSLVLPEFAATGATVMKVVIVSPKETALQIFYKAPGQKDYTEANSRSYQLREGSNTVFFEHNEPGSTEPLRLDPGTAVGNYILNEIEVRTVAAASP